MGVERGNPFVQWAMDTLRLVIMLVLRPEQTNSAALGAQP